MKIRDIITDAFDNPYKGKWEKSEYGDQDMNVKLPDGTWLNIMFNHEGDDEWQVEFHRDNSQEVTGQGDAQRIFATVIAAIQKFIKKQKPWRIIFSASKDVEPGQNVESRARLYNSLVARYARAWGYEEYNEDHGDQVTYELTRIAKEGVAESSGYIPRTAKEAQDPRWSSALTVDVHTDTMKKQIAKFFPTAAPRDGPEQVQQ